MEGFYFLLSAFFLDRLWDRVGDGERVEARLEAEEEDGLGGGLWYGTGRFRALVIRRLSKKLGEPLLLTMEGDLVRDLDLDEYEE